MEALYNHSVSFDPQRCVGCTNCLRRCPTEAIRIREGQARIDASRCIDCGECIKVCTHKAKRAVCDHFEQLEQMVNRKKPEPRPQPADKPAKPAVVVTSPRKRVGLFEQVLNLFKKRK